MKILIDMNLSPDWTQVLTAENIEAVHWSSVGKSNAPDEELMQYARENGYTVFTHDLDFGAMLALTQAESPSVLQVRAQDIYRKASATQSLRFCENTKLNSNKAR